VCLEGRQHAYWGAAGLLRLAGRFATVFSRAGVRGVAEKFRGVGRRALSRTDYASWTDELQALETRRLGEMAREAERFALKPLVSIVMPTYNSPLPGLREAIDSVLAQAYPHWELCIADDASPKAEVRELLKEYAARDRRV